MMTFKKVSRWIKICSTANGKPYFRHNGKRYYLDNFVRKDSPWSGFAKGVLPEYIHGFDATEYYKPYFIEISKDGEAVRLYNHEEKPSNNYSLVNYFDVWGNAKEGWEVNNLCVEYGDLKIADDATEKEILEYLVDSGFLATSDRRKVGIDMSDGFMMEIYAKKGMMPLGRLQMNV